MYKWFWMYFIFAALLTACTTAPNISPSSTLTPLQAQGAKAFTFHCAACHAIVPDTVVVGPSLTGIATRAITRVDGQSAQDYLTMSILKPDAYIVEGFPNSMPNNFGKRLSGEDVEAVIAYLLTLE